MKILGIDPGTAILGYGAVLKNGPKYELIKVGVIRSASGLGEGERLLFLQKELEKIITEVKPEVMVVEKLFFSTNVKTAIKVAQARGMILLTAEKCRLPVIECSPQEIKLGVAGYGNATKQQVQSMVQKILKLDEIPRPDDAADALAAALAVNVPPRNL